jgi:uncharacterized protein YndB with AHSA1/START domain
MVISPWPASIASAGDRLQLSLRSVWNGDASGGPIEWSLGPVYAGVMSGAVTRNVLVRAPRARVFDAFVSVNDLLHWMADGAVIGRRPGGNWSLGWYADPDSDAGYSSIGTIESYEPGVRLVVASLVFGTPEGDDFGPMRLTVDFQEAPDGTLVTVTQEGFGEGPAWDAYRDQLGPGWERMLSDLKGWLEEGRKLPGR